MKNFFLALQFLTRIPVKIQNKIEERDYGCSMAWFPAVGLILGLLLALVFKLALLLFNPAIAVLLAITSYMFLTGAMHIDGLSDVCDGLYGGKGNREKALEIMKDSRIGTMGAIGLILDIGLRFGLLYSLPVSKIPSALIIMAVLGRWGQVFFTLNSPSARPQGRGAYFSANLTKGVFVSASLFMLAICILLLKPFSLFLLLVFISPNICIARSYFKRKIGGITGDAIGALNEAVEIMVLAFFACGI